MLLFNNQPEIYRNKDNYYVPNSVQKYWDTYRANAKWLDEKLTEHNLQSRKDYMEKCKRITIKLYQAGVTILAGTDTPEPYCPPGFSLHDELVLLVESGLPPAAAIKCATLNNARALKQTKNLGSIEVDKIADMVILNANPLSDIRNTRTIYRVIHRGIVCDPKSILPSPRVP
jgi:imidazolonepropionase-like amidohydrolase